MVAVSSDRRRSGLAAAAVLVPLLTGMGGNAVAADAVEIVIRDNRFHPDVVEVPAGQKIRLVITNEGAEAEEFESYELNREKLIHPGRRVTIFLPPLEPGEYPFFSEFHPDTARGRVVVK